jgi:hypothetical protein
MNAIELQERWLEDKQDREKLRLVMKNILEKLTPEQQALILESHLQDDIRVLRWFVEKLISKMASYERGDHE